MTKWTIRRWKAARWIMTIGILIWLGQVAYYQTKYGWHYDAITYTEAMWTTIVDVVLLIGFILFTTVLADVTDAAVKQAEDEQV